MSSCNGVSGWVFYKMYEGQSPIISLAIFEFLKVELNYLQRSWTEGTYLQASVLARARLLRAWNFIMTPGNRKGHLVGLPEPIYIYTLPLTLGNPLVATPQFSLLCLPPHSYFTTTYITSSSRVRLPSSQSPQSQRPSIAPPYRTNLYINGRFGILHFRI